MSYRFVKITTYYNLYLNYYYSLNPDISRVSFKEQYNHLMSDYFGWADFYSKHLTQLGYETHEIIVNADPLQKAWASEHGLNKQGKELLIEQLKIMKAEVVFFENPFPFENSVEFVRELKNLVPSVKQIIAHCCAPYSINKLNEFHVFDYVLSCTPGIMFKLKKLGIHSYRFNHAFEPSILPLIRNDNYDPEVDIRFIGGIAQGPGFHNKRKKILEALCNEGLNLALHTTTKRDSTPKIFAKEIVYNLNQVLIHLGLEKLISNTPLINKSSVWSESPRKNRISRSMDMYIHPPLFGLNMFKSLYKSKIGFNIHIDSVGEYCGNMRMFEVTGVGSCLVTDYKKNINDFFEPDQEVVTYKNVNECVEKISWLLEHDNEREIISNAGQKRTLNEHTYAQRAHQLNSIIRHHFS